MASKPRSASGFGSAVGGGGPAETRPGSRTTRPSGVIEAVESIESGEPAHPLSEHGLARGSSGLEAEPVTRLRCPSCKAAFRGNFTRCMRDGSALIRTTEDPLIGTTIAGRYVIEALVGEGAMGLVYRAHHARLSRLFALKLMFGDTAADASMRLRFAQEADAASRMSHPNVIAVLDFGKTENGLLYLAMEFAEGETLAALLRREGALPERRVIGLAKQMARGLGHAHRAGLVHRDFKPANVATVPAENGELVRILDFGLAIAGGDGNRIGRLTEHGLVVGTPIYISPEQARDQMVDHRADLFALGVVMYEMLAGKPPFEGTSHEIARANVTTAPPPIVQRNPEVKVSAELEAVVMKLLAKKAADRYQSADEVIAALKQIGRRPAPMAQPLPPSPDEDSDRARSPVQWLLSKSGHRAWGWNREEGPAGMQVGAPHRPASVVVTSAATMVDGGPFASQPTAAATKLDRPSPPAAAKAEPSTWPADPKWAADLDGRPTIGMTPASVQRGPGDRGWLRRRGVMAAAWLALATSGVVCTMMEGQRTAAGQSASQTGDHPGAPDSDEGSGWMREAFDHIRCAVTTLGVRPPQTATGRFEGKMDEPARRCPTVPNAEPTGAEPRWSSPAPSAGTDRSRPSAPVSPASLVSQPSLAHQL